MQHKTLLRQLEKLNMSPKSLPTSIEDWNLFLERIDKVYKQFDQDRYLLERSISISSDEIHAKWDEVSQLLIENEHSLITLMSQNKIFNAINEKKPFDEIFKILIEEIVMQLGFDSGFIHQHNVVDNLLKLRINFKDKALCVDRFDINTAKNPIVSTALELKPHFLNDMDEVKYFPNSRAHFYQAMWCTPVVDKQNSLCGVITILANQVRVPTNKEKEILRIASQLATFIFEREETEARMNLEHMKVVSAGKKAALGEMAGGIAHEINNPLAIISGQAQKLILLNELGKLNADGVKEGLDKILATVERISSIIKALRTYSRDDTKIPKSKSNLVQIINDSLSLCSEKIRGSGVKLIKDFEAENISIWCNPVQISQVLINLISNAFDAIKGLNDPWIKIEAKVLKNRAMVRVTDCGAGIPESIRDKIMQPFFTTKDIGHGTGVGLSISQGIVKIHDGALTYNPDSPNTQFVMDVPLYVAGVS